MALNQTEAQIQNILNIGQNYVAAPFLTTTSYNVGDYCSYNGKIYICNTATSGAWVSSRWTETTIGGELSGMNSGFTVDASIASSNVSSGSWTSVYTYTFPAGMYIVEYGVAFSTNATGVRAIGFGSSSSYTAGRFTPQYAAATGDQTRVTSTMVFRNPASTSMAIWAYQTSGSSLAVYPYIRYIKLR